MQIEPWIEDRDTPTPFQSKHLTIINHLHAPRKVSFILCSPDHMIPAENFSFSFLCHYWLLIKMRLPHCIMKIIIIPQN